MVFKEFEVFYCFARVYGIVERVNKLIIVWSWNEMIFYVGILILEGND